MLRRENFFVRFSSLSLAFHFEFTTGNVYFKNWFDYVHNTFNFCMVEHKTKERQKEKHTNSSLRCQIELVYRKSCRIWNWNYANKSKLSNSNETDLCTMCCVLCALLNVRYSYICTNQIYPKRISIHPLFARKKNEEEKQKIKSCRPLWFDPLCPIQKGEHFTV